MSGAAVACSGRRWRAALAVFLAGLVACGGGGGAASGDAAGGLGVIDCGANCAQDALSATEVERVVAQAVLAAQVRGQRATVAVTDRVGNVLAVYAMTGAAATFRIDGLRGVTGGLEGAVLPSALAAISKALTGAYLSSAGNAFSSRTASQIVQDHFNPLEPSQPSGPLFGVQFSQLSCSDLMRRASDADLGPKRSPLGLAADPGGLPLYKAGRVVGGVGVMADGVYSLDLDIGDLDSDVDEQVALAATAGFEAPADIRAQRITADGRTLRYADTADGGAGTSAPPALASLPGALAVVTGYFAGVLRAGVAFGAPASGIRRDTGAFADLGVYIVVDGVNANRFPVRAGTDGGLTAAEVQQVLRSALDVAQRARAQIRQPPGQAAQVTVAVVDSRGTVLGLVRSPDAPVFGTDVALQKARSAAFMSHPLAAAELAALPAAASLTPYVSALRALVGDAQALANGMAYSTRALGNLSRPFFPDGIASAGPGPLSKPFARWSPFSTGLQLDLSAAAIVDAITSPSPSVGCTGLPRLANGLQIFPGGVPIYRTLGGVAQLIGAIGVSGDGVDQDDMIAFLGLSQAADMLGSGLGQAPAAQRADTLRLAGGQLRYVQCPQAPFNGSSEQDPCAGR